MSAATVTNAVLNGSGWVLPTRVISSRSTLAGGGASMVRNRQRTIWDLGQLSDVELIAELDTDDGCVRELVARHHRSVHQLAVAMLHNSSDADEAVQDTFIAAHRGAAGFRGESSARTWLHAICYRRCVGVLRKKHLKVVGIDAALIVAEPAVDNTSRIAIDRAAFALPDDLRVAFTLVDVLGFSRENAAHLVGVSGNTMRARVVRARILLADALGEQEEL